MLPSWVFGVLVPALGLFVAIHGNASDTILDFVYGYTAILVTVLTIWLLRRGKVTGLSGLFEGAFLGGAWFAASIGGVLLPVAVVYTPIGGTAGDARGDISVFIVLTIVALFSLGPWGWTFILNAQRVQAGLQGSPLRSRSVQKWSGFLAPYLFGLTLCAGAAHVESNLTEEIVSARISELDATLNHAFEWRAVVSIHDVVWRAWFRRGATDPEGARRISDSYEQRTGSPLNGSG